MVENASHRSIMEIRQPGEKRTAAHPTPTTRKEPIFPAGRPRSDPLFLPENFPEFPKYLFPIRIPPFFSSGFFIDSLSYSY